MAGSVVAHGQRGMRRPCTIAGEQQIEAHSILRKFVGCRGNEQQRGSRERDRQTIRAMFASFWWIRSHCVRRRPLIARARGRAWNERAPDGIVLSAKTSPPLSAGERV